MSEINLKQWLKKKYVSGFFKYNGEYNGHYLWLFQGNFQYKLRPLMFVFILTLRAAIILDFADIILYKNDKNEISNNEHDIILLLISLFQCTLLNDTWKYYFPKFAPMNPNVGIYSL